MLPKLLWASKFEGANSIDLSNAAADILFSFNSAAATPITFQSQDELGCFLARFWAFFKSSANWELLCNIAKVFTSALESDPASGSCEVVEERVWIAAKSLRFWGKTLIASFNASCASRCRPIFWNDLALRRTCSIDICCFISPVKHRLTFRSVSLFYTKSIFDGICEVCLAHKVFCHAYQFGVSLSLRIIQNSTSV